MTARALCSDRRLVSNRGIALCSFFVTSIRSFEGRGEPERPYPSVKGRLQQRRGVQTRVDRRASTPRRNTSCHEFQASSLKTSRRPVRTT